MAFYNRGMAQDAIFDRVGLALLYEYSWPAAPHHANVFVSEKENVTCFFLSHIPLRAGVVIRNFCTRK